MTLTLRPITGENFWPVLDLKLRPGQEEFVADNAVSIAQTYVEPTYVPLAAYANDELVGFVMYGQNPASGDWWVLRLMIAREHQGKGFGRSALEALIDLMAERVGCEEIVTSFVPANTAAADLYAALGFRLTGEIEDGEEVVRLRRGDRRSS